MFSCNDEKKDNIYTPHKLPDTLLNGSTNLEVYDTIVRLNATELPHGIVGFWKVIDNNGLYALSDPTDPNCLFEGELLGEYTLRWTVSNGVDSLHNDVNLKILGFTDSRDSLTYRVVRIGNQIWMAENLKTKLYQNGQLVEDGSPVGDYSSEFEPKYWFNYYDDTSNTQTYGLLYTWYVVDDSRLIAPQGWHVPTDREWNDMQINLGMNPIYIDIVGISENFTSELLKESGELHWNSPNIATNESGFSALPGGYRRRIDKDFSYLGTRAHFWTSSAADSEQAWYRSMSNESPHLTRSYNFKNYGFSIRCIKNSVVHVQ